MEKVVITQTNIGVSTTKQEIFPKIEKNQINVSTKKNSINAEIKKNQINATMSGSSIKDYIVETLAIRNTIPTANRYVGMRLFVLEDETNYQLIGGIENINRKDSNTGKEIDPVRESEKGNYFDKTTYDPAGGAKQVVFFDDSRLDEYYYFQSDEANIDYYFFGYKMVGGTKRRIRRVSKSDYSVTRAVGNIDYEDNRDDRTALDYSPTL